MWWRVLGMLGVLSVLLLGACGEDDGAGDEGGSAAPPTTAPSTTATTADSQEAVCQEAAGTLGAADPPADLAGVAEGAEAIAELAGDDASIALLPALADVAGGARLLAEAAASDDNAAITDAAATLTDAYDALDLAAADLRLAICTSESWGRQVVIVAVDLTGAGG